MPELGTKILLIHTYAFTYELPYALPTNLPAPPPACIRKVTVAITDHATQLSRRPGTTKQTIKDQILPCFLVDEVALPAAVAKLREERASFSQPQCCGSVATPSQAFELTLCTF